MEKADAILRQGPETPRDRRELAALEENLKEITDRGRPLALRARSFRPALAMDPATGKFALVGGRDYRLVQLSAACVLERFPPALDAT